MFWVTVGRADAVTSFCDNFFSERATNSPHTGESSVLILLFVGIVWI